MQLLQRIKEKALFKQDLQHILSTPQGKRFFRRFLADCHVTRPVFTKDPMETQFNEGKRHLAMSYLKLIASSDTENQLIQQLEKESNNEPIYDTE